MMRKTIQRLLIQLGIRQAPTTPKQALGRWNDMHDSVRVAQKIDFANIDSGILPVTSNLPSVKTNKEEEKK